MLKQVNESYYYDFKSDLEKYPEAWLYVVFGGRNTGKTYSTLRYATENHIKFVYAKRTQDDIKLLCAGNGNVNKNNKKYHADFSPFKSLNRDFNWNIQAFLLYDGVGAFFKCDDENVPYGEPIGYILPMMNASKFKGFDLSDCDWVIFDEFVPKVYDRTIRTEGEAILDLYNTIGRDRVHRGKEDLKLICLANADNASSPLTNTLEITDAIVEMSLKEMSLSYDEDKYILIHKIKNNPEFQQKQEQMKIYQAMAGTRWAQTSLENDFGFNDFTNVQRTNLKNAKPMCKFLYKNKAYYVYYNDKRDIYIVSEKSSNKVYNKYNLDLDNDTKRFYYDIVVGINEATMNDRCTFDKYSIYDLFQNYRKLYNVSL